MHDSRRAISHRWRGTALLALTLVALTTGAFGGWRDYAPVAEAVEPVRAPARITPTPTPVRPGIVCRGPVEPDCAILDSDERRAGEIQSLEDVNRWRLTTIRHGHLRLSVNRYATYDRATCQAPLDLRVTRDGQTAGTLMVEDWSSAWRIDVDLGETLPGWEFEIEVRASCDRPMVYWLSVECVPSPISCPVRLRESNYQFGSAADGSASGSIPAGDAPHRFTVDLSQSALFVPPQGRCAGRPCAMTVSLTVADADGGRATLLDAQGNVLSEIDKPADPAGSPSIARTRALPPVPVEPAAYEIVVESRQPEAQPLRYSVRVEIGPAG